MSYARLDEAGRKGEALEHAIAILGADEATHMAVGGGEKRAEAMATLSGMYHRQATAPEFADWIEAAKAEDLDEMERAAVREFERQYVNLTALPTDFVERQTTARMRSEQLWRDLRAKGDWLSFVPALEAVVDLVREEAQMRSEKLGLAPYDSLMEQYDPGNRVAWIAPVFSTLKEFLKGFVPEALERQAKARADRPLKPLQGPFPTERQRELGLSMMASLGFDLTHGSLSVSHHPFCGGVPTDVRITTRYRADDFLVSFMGVLHETGHALYEQGRPKAWSHWPVGHARGMAVHESQSLFVEQQLARSPEFWEWAIPQVKKHLGEQVFEGWDLGDVLAHVHQIDRSLIRVDADEATYPLHIILRFELEQELVEGRLNVADIPEAWNAKMVEYLGLSTIDDPANGPMQDVHWPAGLFGYFPSYTLGALTAAQLWARLERDMPDAPEQVRRGDFSAINQWRAEQIWSQGSRWSTPELIERATGEKLNPRFFTEHLRRRYLA